MILVDSSVWIDYFGGARSLQVERLDDFLGRKSVAVGDLSLTEILQGIRGERQFEQVRAYLTAFPQIAISTPRSAVAAAQNYRTLRARGITVRKTINTLIATRCILDDLPLLFSDRDFEPYVEHLGLIDAMDL